MFAKRLLLIFSLMINQCFATNVFVEVPETPKKVSINNAEEAEISYHPNVLSRSVGNISCGACTITGSLIGSIVFATPFLLEEAKIAGINVVEILLMGYGTPIVLGIVAGGVFGGCVGSYIKYKTTNVFC